MRIFINKRTALYSGGMVIVAANTIEEAQGILLAAFPDEISMLDEDGDVCFDESGCVTKEHWNYKSNNWVETKCHEDEPNVYFATAKGRRMTNERQ